MMAKRLTASFGPDYKVTMTKEPVGAQAAQELSGGIGRGTGGRGNADARMAGVGFAGARIGIVQLEHPQIAALIAGAGIRGGMVHGESDKIGAYVKDSPVRPQDLGATIYHALGVPFDTQVGAEGFNRPITSAEPLWDLFG